MKILGRWDSTGLYSQNLEGRAGGSRVWGQPKLCDGTIIKNVEEILSRYFIVESI